MSSGQGHGLLAGRFRREPDGRPFPSCTQPGWCRRPPRGGRGSSVSSASEAISVPNYNDLNLCGIRPVARESDVLRVGPCRICDARLWERHDGACLCAPGRSRAGRCGQGKSQAMAPSRRTSVWRRNIAWAAVRCRRPMNSSGGVAARRRGGECAANPGGQRIWRRSLCVPHRNGATHAAANARAHRLGDEAPQARSAPGAGSGRRRTDARPRRSLPFRLSPHAVQPNLNSTP